MKLASATRREGPLRFGGHWSLLSESPLPQRAYPAPQRRRARRNTERVRRLASLARRRDDVRHPLAHRDGSTSTKSVSCPSKVTSSSGAEPFALAVSRAPSRT